MVEVAMTYRHVCRHGGPVFTTIDSPSASGELSDWLTTSLRYPEGARGRSASELFYAFGEGGRPAGRQRTARRSAVTQYRRFWKRGESNSIPKIGENLIIDTEIAVLSKLYEKTDLTTRDPLGLFGTVQNRILRVPIEYSFYGHHLIIAVRHQTRLSPGRTRETLIRRVPLSAIHP
jgi:hypothetical protein